MKFDPRSALLAWFDHGHRDLPWRRTQDPYRIWLSEIMLQQTRAAAVIPYYEAFLQRFPTVDALANASESDVLARWSGLGYYSRARNLRKAAIEIAALGEFPRDFDTIRALPGIGPYTAAAVASIAFGLPHAVLDGNVVRVISRLTADPADISTAAARNRLQATADQLLDRARPGAFNQAMMELGATVCLPRTPLCLMCPVSALCQAQATGVQNELPIKAPRAVQLREEVELAVVRRGQRVLMRRRAAHSSRMAGFWELPGLKDLPGLADTKLAGAFRHTIVNHLYAVKVYTGGLVQVPKSLRWMTPRERGEAPVTTMARKAIKLAKC